MKHIDEFTVRDVPRFFLVVVFIAGLVIGGVSVALIQYVVKVQNIGIVRVIGVMAYEDQNLTNVLEYIDWGLVDPGENKTYPTWIVNTGNDQQTLSIWTENWSPTNASNWIDLTWDYGGSWITVNASVSIVFTLHVHPNITGITNFSFDIWIQGVS